MCRCRRKLDHDHRSGDGFEWVRCDGGDVGRLAQCVCGCSSSEEAERKDMLFE
ncbi:hypothetical protein DEO72_LG11g1639 [Vigna unguiculata]|uniref:Uncharacterized protein n=1 Tax=Vigna unguiculata TaxID=3917 RepID=A0A4D6NLW3_VIGUN|nr:hypothetical protein DEO72_LG11g1639 [Vigna unguiculata]